MDRISRRLTNLKQNKISVSKVQPSLQTLREGDEILYQPKNKSLRRYRREGHVLWYTSMIRDGNFDVDKKLKTKHFEYTQKFIDYRVFQHNFQDDLPATKIYVPWQSALEQSDLLDKYSSFLTPFKMTCHKILFRPPAIDTAATDIVFGIEKIDSGDTTVDSVCTFDATSNWVDNTNFIINQSDWTASPTVGEGDVVGISIQADNTNIVTSAKEFSLTSVWRVEVVI